MVNEEESLSSEDKELIKAIQGSAPEQEIKHGIFQFFSNILKTKDTTKVSNLKDVELQMVRVLKNVSIYSDAMGLQTVNDYAEKKAEALLGTALSRDGFLVTKAVTAKKDISISEGKKKSKSKWYKKEVEGGEE